MEKVMILATPAEIAEGLRIFLSENSKQKQNDLPEFENDRITKAQAAKLAGISIPTLSKMVREGKFKEYSLGQRRKYFLKSEIIEALRNNG
jgi:predicted DNA-binding transcriptional regulator AlpA